MTDDEKHARAQKRGWSHAIFLPPLLYAKAEAMGLDMDDYVIQKPIPESYCVGAFHNATIKPGDAGREVYAVGSIMTDEQMKAQYAKPVEYSKLAPSSAQRWNDCPGARPTRKSHGEKYCGGITCLPGKGGKCVACADEE